MSAMSVLLEAVDAGSLSEAGRRLGMPLATVSRKVSELEAHLGTKILARSNRRLALTDAGMSYVESCRRILDDIAEVERTAAGEYRAPRGNLTVTAPIVFGRSHVLPLLKDFLNAFPSVDVRLDLSDRRVDFTEEHADVAVRIGVLPDSGLIATKIGETRQSVCASPTYLAARGIPQAPKDLIKHDCITFDRLNAPEIWRFDRNRSETRAAIHSRLTVSTAEAAIDAAIAGVGITRVLCYQIAEHVRDGRLERLLRDFEPAPSPISLIYPDHGRLPMKLRAFLDFMTPRLRTSTQDVPNP